MENITNTELETEVIATDTDTDTEVIEPEINSNETVIIDKTDEELIENGQARLMTADDITDEMREAGVDETTVLITDPEVIAEAQAEFDASLAETTESDTLE